MKSGRLRHQVRIERFIPSGTVDANNHPEGSFQAIRSPHCSFEGMGGTTDEEARQQVHQAMFRVRMHYFPDLELTDRIVWKGRQFEIAHIHNVEFRDREYEVFVQEVQSDQ